MKYLEKKIIEIFKVLVIFFSRLCKFLLSVQLISLSLSISFAGM